MRLHDKHLVAMIHQGSIQANHHVMKLEDTSYVIDIIDEWGVPREQVKLMREKVGRT